MSIIGETGILSVGGEIFDVIPIERNVTTGGHFGPGNDEILCRVISGAYVPGKIGDYEFKHNRDGSLSFVKRGPKIESRALLIKNVIFNDPATIVYWNDGTKTVVKCQPGDTFSEELGLAMAISKKFLGNKGNFNDVFKSFLPEKDEKVEKTERNISIEKMRNYLDAYCVSQSRCLRCSLYEFSCLKSKGFLAKEGDNYRVTDDEIRDAYKIVFGDK